MPKKNGAALTLLPTFLVDTVAVAEEAACPILSCSLAKVISLTPKLMFYAVRREHGTQSPCIRERGRCHQGRSMLQGSWAVLSCTVAVFVCHGVTLNSRFPRVFAPRHSVAATRLSSHHGADVVPAAGRRRGSVPGGSPACPALAYGTNACTQDDGLMEPKETQRDRRPPCVNNRGRRQHLSNARHETRQFYMNSYGNIPFAILHGVVDYL